MGKVLNFLGKKMARTFGNALAEINKIAVELENVDYEKEFEKMSKSFNEKMDILLKKNDKYVMEIPYNRDTQTLQSKIEDNLFTVIVEEKTENGDFTSKSSTTVTIPNDVCVDKITQEYDKERKMMVFSMKKNRMTFDVEEVVSEPQQVAENEPLVVEVELDDEPQVVRDTTEKKPKTSEELLKIMIEMYRNGASFKAIAKEVGLSDKTVAKYIRRVLGKEA